METRNLERTTLDTRNQGTQTMDPPPEARPRTVHRIYIPTPQKETSHINKIKQKRRISRLDPYIAVTLEEALMTITDEESTIGRLNRLQTLEDLEVSPSSSCSTKTQDETENTENVTITRVYGIFSAHKVSKVAKIRNRYNQVPHLTQDTNGKVTNSQKTPQTRAKRSALSQQVTTKHI